MKRLVLLALVCSLLAFTYGGQAQPLPTDLMIENAYVKFVFDVNADNYNLKTVTKKDTGYTFSFTSSDAWELRPLTATPPYDPITILGSNAASCTTSYSLNIGTNPKTLTLRWKDCTFTGLSTSNKVDVTITITLYNNEDFSRWRISVSNNMPEYAINTVRLPFFIKEDATQTTFLVHPFEVGWLVKNPADTFTPEKEHNSNGVSMQMVPFYTAGGDGLFLQSADPEGTATKWYSFYGDGTSLKYRIGFFVNDDIVAGNDFSLPYDYYVGVFNGDWYDAAKRYRSWAQNQPILEQGKLKTRIDIPDWYKNLDLFSLTGVRATQNYGTVTQGLNEAKNFYEAENALHFIWFSWKESPTTDGYGVYEPDTYIPQYMQSLNDYGFHTAVYTLTSALSRNTSYWSQLQSYACGKRSGELTQNPNHVVNDAYFMDPSQTAWQTHYATIVKQNLITLAHAGGNYFDAPYGTFFGCYQSAIGHPVGMGSTYFFGGYKQLLKTVRQEARTIDPDYITFYEKEDEKYISVADTALMSSTDDSVPVGTEASTSSIPFFPTVYKDYIVEFPANNHPDYFTQGYTDTKDFIFRTAINAIYGAVPNTQEAAFEKELPGYELNYKLNKTTLFGQEGQDVTAAAYFTRDLVRLRKYVREYLIFGELLRSLTTNAPLVSRTFCPTPGTSPHTGCSDPTYNVWRPEVLTSTWRTIDGDIGLFFINYNNVSKVVEYQIDVNKYGLDPATTYGLFQRDPSGSVSNKGKFTGKTNITTIFPRYSSTFYEVIPFPLFSTFNGETTDFYTVNDIRTVAATIEKTGAGKITYTSPIDLSGANLDAAITISDKQIAVNTVIEARLNAPATLTFENVSFEVPKIYRDGQPCTTACSNMVYDREEKVVTVSVTGFSTYTVENSTPSCGDGFCTGEENVTSCAADCLAVCGDGFCTGNETVASCSEDCIPVCGDGTCEGNETNTSCAADCATNTTVCTDGTTQTCSTGLLGVCSAGTQTCGSNAWGSCVQNIVSTPEVCDGLDNNCNGVVDESGICECTNGDTKSCGSNVGACSNGTQTCSMGSWGSCLGSVGPTIEVCTNSEDDDCDGEVNEGCAIAATNCQNGIQDEGE
ncbi:MAG: hypothetical protein KKA90_00005, partial [Nanoarchaeota archaeon]|nr:hypothetical protein [Nanoarchaeota archaeon]